MPDLEHRLPEMLHDLSTRMSVDLDLERPTLRRGRRRRAFNTGVAALLVAAVVAGGLTAVAALSPARNPSIAGSSQSPADRSNGSAAAGTIEAIWPETTLDGLTAAQQQIDDGHEPWRTDPEQTAVAFATNVIGWVYEDVHSGTLEQTGDRATVWIEDPRISSIVAQGSGGAADPRTIVKLRQIGKTGPMGVWSVLAVEGQMIHLQPPAASDGAVEVSGSLTYVSEAETVRIDVLDGADLASSIAGGVAPLGPDFDARFPVASTDGRVTVLVRVLGAKEDTLAATAYPLTIGSAATASPQSTATPEAVREGGGAQLPDAVAQTRDAILGAVRDRDFQAMAALIEPDTFVYNFDDGSDPIPAWKEDPSVLDEIPAILRLDHNVVDVMGYGTFYVWPYLMEAGSLDQVSAEERADLHALGLSDADIEQMRAYGDYTGPRLAIDENGVWRNYVTGGD